MTRSFIIFLGCVAAVMLMLYPEIKSMRQSPGPAPAQDDKRRFEQQVRAAQDVSATEEEEEERRPVRRRRVSIEEDERISAQKNYQPPEWRPKFVCEPLWDMPWITSCHQRFERPLPRQRTGRVVRYGPDVRACRRGGCPYDGD